MKKIVTLALCVASVASMSAQKPVVEQASKLSGKLDKIEDARTFAKQAIAEQGTPQQQARAYYVAGKIEFDAFKQRENKKLINPQDPAVDPVEMGYELLNGYDYYMKAMPLDAVPDEKGKSGKYLKDMSKTLSQRHDAYYASAAEFYNQRKYYPEAYNAFMIYGDMPGMEWADAKIQAVADTTRALAYYYAGISAYSSNNLLEAAVALKKARLNNIKDMQSYIYEIATWQNISNRDESKAAEAEAMIDEIAKAGYAKFGIQNLVFINNIATSLVNKEKYDEALALMNGQLSQTPNEPGLYATRAWIQERKGDEEAAVEDYRKAAEFENATYDILERAAKKVYNHGSEIWNAIEGNQPEKRQEVKVKYFEAAKAFAEKAQAMDPNNGGVDDVLERINYALDTFFPNK
ncbi:MAG: hypothetical protein ACI4AK_04800 [Lepagella sp.]